MKKRLCRLISVFFLCAFSVCLFSGCAGAVCISELTVTDAGGAGERVCYIYSPAVNSEYIDAGDAQATFLTEYLISALGESDAAAYTVKYEGTVSAEDAGLVNSLYELSAEDQSLGYHLFSMRYTFSDIKDYNRKTSRLYNLSRSLAMDSGDDNYRVGMLDDYVDTVLRVTDTSSSDSIPSASSTVTLTETGSVSYGVVAWAFIALYRNRQDETMWKDDEIYFAPFSDNESHTVFSALKTQLTVRLGETVRTVTPITGPVIEGQGEVEGIVFNVTGTLPDAQDESVSVWLIVTICVGAVLAVAAAVASTVLIIKKKRQR